MLRIMLFILAALWIVFFINIIPSKKCFLSYVGSNTMPVYVFHLALRYVIQFFGLYVNLFACIFVGILGILGVIFSKYKNNFLYAVTVIATIAGAYYFFSSGVLEPLYNKTSSNIWITYGICYGSALIAGIGFVSPFWVKLYNILVEGFSYFPITTKFLQGVKNEENPR